MLGLLASRICGSADIYAKSGKGPEGSINFLTCHDGLTLNDLVSIAPSITRPMEKLITTAPTPTSDNYGTEGATTDARIETLRKRQIKNFLLTLLASRGVPMLLGGDEVRRTQGGNNNAYCQDNTTSWFDWTQLEQHQEIYRFACGMIAFRRAHPVLSEEKFYTKAQVRWLAASGRTPDWFDPKAKSLACLIQEGEQATLLLLFNAGTNDIAFSLPPPANGSRWQLAVDTCASGCQNLSAPGSEPVVNHSMPYRLHERSSAIFLARGQKSSSIQSAP